MTCRLLPITLTDGSHNMAADEALLESAAAGGAALRLYGWSEPTLSLGYFQAASLRESNPRMAALPFVRRVSGGAALVHHHELTYALALPAGWPWQPRGESWLCRMHGIIAAALQSLGGVIRAVSCQTDLQLGNFLCFQHHTPGDVLVAGDKVAGSAQRRQRGALLQHGAILLARSPFTPELPGLRELTGTEKGVDQVAAALLAAFGKDTGYDLIPAEWTPSEVRRMGELATEKYGCDSWNRKR